MGLGHQVRPPQVVAENSYFFKSRQGNKRDGHIILLLLLLLLLLILLYGIFKLNENTN